MLPLGRQGEEAQEEAEVEDSAEPPGEGQEVYVDGEAQEKHVGGDTVTGQQDGCRAGKPIRRCCYLWRLD